MKPILSVERTEHPIVAISEVCQVINNHAQVLAELQQILLALANETNGRGDQS